MTETLLTVKQRFWYAAIGCGLLTLLLVTRFLRPNELGLGTHQQLGLPPCTMLAFWGVPCPTCGMTTSWAYFTRGNIVQAWRCNPGGVCLAFAAITVAGWTTSIAVAGVYQRWISQRSFVLLACVVTAITFVHWYGRIF